MAGQIARAMSNDSPHSCRSAPTGPRMPSPPGPVNHVARHNGNFRDFRQFQDTVSTSSGANFRPPQLMNRSSVRGGTKALTVVMADVPCAKPTLDQRAAGLQADCGSRERHVAVHVDFTFTLHPRESSPLVPHRHLDPFIGRPMIQYGQRHAVR